MLAVICFYPISNKGTNIEDGAQSVKNEAILVVCGG